MVLYLLNTRENDVNYLVKDKMMQKGFRYLYKNSDTFHLEIINLKRNISLLAEGVLTEEVLKKVKKFIHNRIENYLKELKDEDVYIANIIDKIKIDDAETVLSELYFKSQVYFLYNEVFTYGVMESILKQQIAKNKLDIEKTLLELSNYKGTAVYKLYNMLVGFKIPNTEHEFIKLQKKDKKFRKAIDTISTNIADYFEEKPTLNEIYYMIKAANEHTNLVNAEIGISNIGKPLIQLYVFIVDTQRELFICQNIYMKAMKRIFKKFPKLDKMYGNQKPKGHLLNLYLNKIKELKGYKLSQPNVYYNGAIFDLDERRIIRLSDQGSKMIEAIINKKVAEGLSILDASEIAKKLNKESIIKNDIKKSKRPSSYIFMLLQTEKGSRRIVGGKASSLLALHKAGLDIPPFFILTTKAVQHLINQDVDKKFILEIKNIYKTIIKKGKVAVRSSATIEDSRKSSFAGQFKTVLNVDINNLYEAIKEVYSSISNVEAVYGPRIKHRSKIEMSIIIQKMVNSDKAGVIFTADPVDGNKDKIIIEVVKGLGEALVSGSKTPTRYYISKTDGSILNRSGKNLITVRELKQLYNMAISIEKLFGHPQDIEFAVKKGKIYILQSRDITTL